MNKFKYLLSIAVGVCAFSSCEDALDTDDPTISTTEVYPSTVAQAKIMLAGVYNNLSVVNANPQMSFYYLSELASDDRLGGGGVNDKLMQALDVIGNSGNDMLKQFWVDRYAGVARANNAILTLPNCQGYEKNEQKLQMLGEAYFLRAFYYYELASQWGKIPVFLEITKDTKPQDSAETIWGQILYDLKWAADSMPAYNAATAGEGHVNKYIAEAMLGRAYLFYTGFYCNGEELNQLVSTNYKRFESVELTAANGETVKLTDEEVAAYLEDCIKNSGYKLNDNFCSNLAYCNKVTKEDYVTLGLEAPDAEFAEDDNKVNPETMFVIKYNDRADWNTTIGYSNGYALHFGTRGQASCQATFPFGQGWGAGPVAPNLWDDWEKAEPEDTRRAASISDMRVEMPNYKLGAGNDFVQETDYYAKKNVPVCAIKSSDGEGGYIFWACYECEMFPELTFTQNGSNNMQTNNIHDMHLIRFADVLLMHSELTDGAPVGDSGLSGMNQVRKRAGLSSDKVYSLEALQNERRWELAFEGTRWNDIRRWHIAAEALEKQTNKPCYYAGQEDQNTPHLGGYKARYEATAGFFKIPETEISIADGDLEQNPGWGAGSDYSSWK